MPKNIVHIDDLEPTRELSHGDRFAAKMAPISAVIGAAKIGCNITTVPPGKRAFPIHNHHVIEELFFVLEGEGRLRFGDEEHPVRQGDFIACPSGGPEVAHQLVNTGEGDLCYLAMSSTTEADVVQYPESGKFLTIAGHRPGTRPDEAGFFGIYTEGAKAGYWDGE